MSSNSVPKSWSEKHVKAIAKSIFDARLKSETLDISLPGIERPLGVRHPVLRTLDELISVFVKMGYSIAEGPEVESDYYNFEALELSA